MMGLKRVRSLRSMRSRTLCSHRAGGATPAIPSAKLPSGAFDFALTDDYAPRHTHQASLEQRASIAVVEQTQTSFAAGPSSR